VVQAVMDFDHLQPMAEGRTPLKILHAKVGFQKHFLCQVFGYAFVACDVTAISHNAPLMAFH
jgi:hypothetical protein